jgi:murein L,D-transpeptidase YcbB/YkuD
VRLLSSPVAGLALVALLSWGVFDGLFGDEDAAPAAPAAGAVAAEVARVASAPVPLAGRALHPTTRSLYARDGHAARWRTASARAAITNLLDEAAADGVSHAEVRLGLVDALRQSADEAAAAWAALDGAARDTLADPRPVALARLDLALTDGLLWLGDALRGRRTDPRRLHPGTWFATARDTSGAAFGALQAAVLDGDAGTVEAALDGLRPQQDGYRRLRARLAALQDDLAPVPEGAPLRAGERSVRVPHVRDRLAALGYLPASESDAWARPDAYLLDDALAAALARFETAHDVEPDSVLDAATTDALNADPADLRRQLAINLERWRWLPDDLGGRLVWVNLPAFELRALERDSTGGYAERLRMPVNIGNAQTTGWTTPVITDSVHTLEFQPAWYVPRSLAAADVFPRAQRDSLALWRQGFEVYRNGAPVDSRLVAWDSVSVGEFRFVQRPGPANPLGRVKFLMHNPYAILIHDTNKRHTFSDGVGSSMSSGCVQAGAPDELAEYLLTSVNDWTPGAATAAWRGGPRRGVRLEHPVTTQFTYFTAWAEADGALRLYADPYGYDDAWAEALGLAEDAEETSA